MAKTMRYSRQRERIYQYLTQTREHPTAERIYTDLRQELPELSLGTVYRNLSLLTETGQIMRLSYGGADHFDGNPQNHYHLHCTSCNRVYDIEMPMFNKMEEDAEKHSKAKITNHILTFIGICENCQN